MSAHEILDSWTTNLGDEVQVWQADNGEYRWRVRAKGNHEIVGQGEGHPDLDDAVTAAKRHHPPVAEQ